MNRAEGQGQYGYEERSLAWFRAQAERGDPEAQLALGRLLELGIGHPADPAGAEVWYRRAARAGNPEAQFRLARLLQSGTLGAPRQQEAAEWYGAAAEAGLAAAAYNLAVMREAGIGGPPDREAARRLYRKAYGGGIGAAAVNLALIELSDDPSDRVAAYSWLLRAEAAGEEAAAGLAQDLGLMLEESERRQAEAAARAAATP